MYGSEIELYAPAKVNLHLEVLHKRQDGYHNIRSLFIAVSLFDRIVIRSLKEKGKCTVTGNCGVKSRVNLAVKAYNLFKKAAGINNGVSILLEKNIPKGAGLGGGSSDAASVIKGLNRLFNTGLPIEVQQHIASELGNDVPFFLNGTAAFIEGTGGIIKSLIPRLDFTILLINPGVHISTKEAFSKLDRTVYGEDNLLTKEVLCDTYFNKPVKDWNFFNTFYSMLITENKELKEVERNIDSVRPDFSGISGSGSTFFCIFSDIERAYNAFDNLKKLYDFVKLCKPLEVQPKAILKLGESEAT